MNDADIITLWLNNNVDPACRAYMKSLWQLFAWFMTYYTPPTIVVYIAYHFGKRTFVKEKELDRKTLLLSREHEFIKKRYIIEGLDKILSSLDWYLAHYTSNHSIAIEVAARCKTQRISKIDTLEDLNFKPINMLHDVSPFLRINNLVGDNIYHLLMQLVHARTETYYYSRCLGIIDLGKHILKNRDSATKKEYDAFLKELENLKESETDMFYKFHNIPYSLLRIIDALEKSMMQDELLVDFRENKIVKEGIQNMEKLFNNELKQYERYRVQG